MTALTSLERAVFEKLLAGDSPILATLRRQVESAVVAKREMTGVGFFTTVSVLDPSIRLPDHRSLTIGDVFAEIDGLKNGAGFVLFVKDGGIHMLEGFSYDEPWPKEVGKFHVAYSTGEQRDPKEIEQLESSGPKV